MPWKSRDLGKAILISLSKKSYILCPLRVQQAPISMPCLVLKAEIAFLAFVAMTFCPAIKVKSPTIASTIFWGSSPVLPTTNLPNPVFNTTFSILGTAILDL